MRVIAISAVFILSIGCSKKGTENAGGQNPEAIAPLDPKEAKENLVNQAKSTNDAVINCDHQTVVDKTYPRLVDVLGGRDVYLTKLETMYRSAKAKGFSLGNLKMGDSSELVTVDDEMYAVIPYEIDMTGPGGMKGRLASFLIGVSADKGRDWKFIDGGTLSEDSSKLKRLLPRFPETLQFPKTRLPDFKKPNDPL